MTQPVRARVLVIDDEPYLLRSVRLVLAQHDVTTLTDARAALALLTSGARFDVVLCDLTMPELSGMDFHRELARTAPDEADRVVFLTGGAFTPAAEEFLARVPNARVDKPFKPADLRALVVERLAQAHAR